MTPASLTVIKVGGSLFDWCEFPVRATDFLARSFSWKLPGAGTARGLGIAALQALGPLKSALAKQMMFGSR